MENNFTLEDYAQEMYGILNENNVFNGQHFITQKFCISKHFDDEKYAEKLSNYLKSYFCYTKEWTKNENLLKIYGQKSEKRDMLHLYEIYKNDIDSYLNQHFGINANGRYIFSASSYCIDAFIRYKYNNGTNLNFSKEEFYQFIYVDYLDIRKFREKMIQLLMETDIAYEANSFSIYVQNSKSFDEFQCTKKSFDQLRILKLQHDIKTMFTQSTQNPNEPALELPDESKDLLELLGLKKIVTTEAEARYAQDEISKLLKEKKILYNFDDNKLYIANYEFKKLNFSIKYLEEFKIFLETKLEEINRKKHEEMATSNRERVNNQALTLTNNFQQGNLCSIS